MRTDWMWVIDMSYKEKCKDNCLFIFNSDIDFSFLLIGKYIKLHSIVKMQNSMWSFVASVSNVLL